jgi:hypothetical protein
MSHFPISIISVCLCGGGFDGQAVPVSGTQHEMSLLFWTFIIAILTSCAGAVLGCFLLKS